MDDLRAAGVDFLTIGQYLQPTPSTPRSIVSGRRPGFLGACPDERARGFPCDGLVSPLTQVELSRGRATSRASKTARLAQPRLTISRLATRHQERRVVRTSRPSSSIWWPTWRVIGFCRGVSPARSASAGRRSRSPNWRSAGHSTKCVRVVAPDDVEGPRIDTTGIEGPFRLLKSRWIFRPIPRARRSTSGFWLREVRSLLRRRFSSIRRRCAAWSAFEARAARSMGSRLKPCRPERSRPGDKRNGGS